MLVTFRCPAEARGLVVVRSHCCPSTCAAGFTHRFAPSMTLADLKVIPAASGAGGNGDPAKKNGGPPEPAATAPRGTGATAFPNASVEESEYVQ